MLNVNFNQFKSGYLKKRNQVLFYSINTKGEREIINLINNSPWDYVKKIALKSEMKEVFLFIGA